MAAAAALAWLAVAIIAAAAASLLGIAVEKLLVESLG